MSDETEVKLDQLSQFELIQTVQHLNAELASLRAQAARVAELDTAVNEAREIFENIFKRDWSNGKINDKARAWLAAHTPAPEKL